jgi:hypothetical protein
VTSKPLSSGKPQQRAFMIQTTSPSLFDRHPYKTLVNSLKGNLQAKYPIFNFTYPSLFSQWYVLPPQGLEQAKMRSNLIMASLTPHLPICLSELLHPCATFPSIIYSLHGVYSARGKPLTIPPTTGIHKLQRSLRAVRQTRQRARRTRIARRLTTRMRPEPDLGGDKRSRAECWWRL